VRHSRPAKQRLWLGPDRYISGCYRRITHANAYSDGYSYRHSHSYCHCDGYGYGDGHSQCDADSQHYSHAATNAYAEACANTPASPHTGTETVEALGRTQVFAIVDRC
jgi:hypothetical protein